MPTANEIRQQFIDFFVKKHGHTFVPSSSVVPLDDPTLLFTNAGMNQFKDVFLGTGTRPFKRAANTQKVIRAGGKHNDLDDVGKDTYHHTFFEMLGNWSFGDYFKKEAIRWAWELLTEVWKLDKSRLHATVFAGDEKEGLARDDDAAELWRSETDIDPSHIHFRGKKDNFWEMGETGPCGPCTEILLDRTADKSGIKLIDESTEELIEIWNLVFIQFNRGPDKILTPLPAKHVDTGMGFERVTSVLQGKSSNYDTDVFTPIMEAIGDLTGKKYGGKIQDPDDVAFRVIADHIRMLTFAITDGALPDNKGRGAVVRSVLRRAFRFGYQQFGQRTPFLYKLVPTLVANMGSAYPELTDRPQRVQEIIRREETDFLRTIGRGIELFDGYVARTKAFTEDKMLVEYDEDTPPRRTIGWTVALPADRREGRVVSRGRPECNSSPRCLQAPYDLRLPARYDSPDGSRRRGLSVDLAGYERLLQEHRQVSSGDAFKVSESAQVTVHSATDDSPKWSTTEIDSVLQSILAGDQVVGDRRFLTSRGESVRPSALMADPTCFYAEQGGQVGDKGTITTATGVFEVLTTVKRGSTVFHIGVNVQGQVEPDQPAKLRVSPEREFIKKNHTSTHLLNWALRRVLGGDVDQKGSLVDADKTRFDFTHDKPLTEEEVAEVERLVNEKIYSDLPVSAVTMPLAEAKKIPGVRAVFGEKYPDPVRVLLIGASKPDEATLETSVEFCGGTHLNHTGQAGFFKIVSQENVAKGVRRVTAVTGRKAVETVQQLSSVVGDLSGRLNCKPEEIPGRVEALQEEIKKLQSQLKKGTAGDLAGAADQLLATAADVNGAKIVVGAMPAAPVEQMRQQLDRIRQIAKSAVVVLGWAEDSRVTLLAAVTEDLTGKVEAGKLVGEAAKVVGGKGGGRKDMAQAGGNDPSKLSEALDLARKVAGEKLKG